MWRLLFSFAILQLVRSSCPKGFELVRDGQCRGLQASPAANMTIPFEQGADKAKAKCDEIQAQTVIIHNDEQQSYWKGKAPTTTTAFLIIGLVCNTKSKKWEWADGSALDFKPPKNLYNPELDRDCTPQLTWDIHPDGYWSYGNNGYVAVQIYCTTQLKQADPEEGCDTEDKVCYQVAVTPANWQDAEKICQNQGTHLASIHNSRENSFVRRVAVANGALNGVSLGASAREDEPFRWIDGTTMDYENYAPGFPKKNFGQCVVMDTSSSSGQWMNVDCNAKFPVACVRKGLTLPDPMCSEEEWKEGETITSPGFPNSAYTPCDYFLTVPAGKKVKTEIQLEANSCCDSLVLYDGYIGGAVIANLTGEVRNGTFTTKTSNVMRVSWQPKGGVNVRGLAMTFRGI